MSVSSLEDKTIRPGSFMGYSYYHSDRRPRAAAAEAAPKSRSKKTWLTLVIGLVLAGSAVYALGGSTKPANHSTLPPNKASSSATVLSNSSSNLCSGNTLRQLIGVSITRRHLWACNGGKELYNSPVVTGMAMYPDTVTPTGTYHIYAKATDTTLTGSDSTGSWSDPVSYWMPFLNNQYGTYGLHDATWRPNSAFGNVDPNSTQASHGCVELPLNTARWLYNWAQVGTTVTISS